MNKYVFFDIDGTLNQTVLYAVEAYKKALRRRNIFADEEKIVSCIGLTPDEIAKELLGNVTEQEMKCWQKEIRECEAELIKTKASAFPGVQETLEKLQERGYHLAVCSNAFPEHIEGVLASIGVRQYFSQIGSLKMGKDKTEVLEALLKHTQCGAACMVGDRIFDIQAARANHIPVIGCGYGYAPAEMGAADIVVNRAADIYEAVCKLI